MKEKKKINIRKDAKIEEVVDTISRHLDEQGYSFGDIYLISEMFMQVTHSIFSSRVSESLRQAR